MQSTNLIPRGYTEKVIDVDCIDYGRLHLSARKNLWTFAALSSSGQIIYKAQIELYSELFSRAYRSPLRLRQFLI